MSQPPDKIIDLKSSFFSVCRQSLETKLFVLSSIRQVVEFPPITSIYKRYRQYFACNHQQLANFSLGVNALIQCKSIVKTLLGNFSIYQYIPFKRLQSLFSQLFSLPVSQGNIDNIFESSAQKCSGVYQEIKTQIRQRSVVDSDETGAKVYEAK